MFIFCYIAQEYVQKWQDNSFLDWNGDPVMFIDGVVSIELGDIHVSNAADLAVSLR